MKNKILTLVLLASSTSILAKPLVMECDPISLEDAKKQGLEFHASDMRDLRSANKVESARFLFELDVKPSESGEVARISSGQLSFESESGKRIRAGIIGGTYNDPYELFNIGNMFYTGTATGDDRYVSVVYDSIDDVYYTTKCKVVKHY